MAIKGYNDNEAVRSRGQDLASTTPSPHFQTYKCARLVGGIDLG